jgi:peptide/nickel transport system permease protein
VSAAGGPGSPGVAQATPTARGAASAVGATRRRSPGRALLRDPQALVSGAVLLVITVLGLLAPLLASHTANQVSLNAVNAPFGAPGYPLGGDAEGRDIFARLLYSTDTALVSGLIGAAVALAIGVSAGLVGGYFGGRLRGTVEWLFALLMTFPGLLLLILLMPVTKGNYQVTMALFGVLLSPGVYRLTRNQVLSVRHELYIDAARVSGLGNMRILGRHVLYAVRGPIVIASAFLVGAGISVQSGLAFLGLGSAFTPSFGGMLIDAFGNLYIAPLQVLWPSLMLGLFSACLVLLGNALRDALAGPSPQPAKAARAAAKAARAARTSPSAPDGPGTAAASHADAGLLEVEDLVVAYPAADGTLAEVVRGATFSLAPGEVLGLVGESGSGKTQTAFAVLGVLPQEAVLVRGSVRLDGRELLGAGAGELRRLRAGTVSYVPQEPTANLDPSHTVGAQLVEGARAAARLSRREAREQVLALLKRVGIDDAERVFRSYPHQISGGMAQRVLIAGAVASRPRLLIADEPTTALDVTVQAEILDLLRELRKELNMAVLLVTHDFGVVADSCDRVAVMREGHVVETAGAREVFTAPRHPYTRMLLDSILDENAVRADPAPGEAPRASAQPGSER